MSFDRRHGRTAFSFHAEVPIRWLPWLLVTTTDWTTPWVWRLYWLRFCLGRLKSDWAMPTKLTRQLRRQLERKGRLVLGAAGLFLAVFACPTDGHAGDWCLTWDAVLARAIINYNVKQGNTLEPNKAFELYLRANGIGSCTQTAAGAEESTRLLEKRADESALRVLIGETVGWALYESEYLKRYGRPYWGSR